MPEIAAPFLDAVYLTGPTAVGKSEISLLLAERLDAEIIALDAMTLYQGMDIGTAKPSAEDRKRIPHHLLDTVSPQQLSNLDQYLIAAAEVVQDLARRGKTALFVGAFLKRLHSQGKLLQADACQTLGRMFRPG